MSTYTAYQDRIEEELDMYKPMYYDLRVAASSLSKGAERFVKYLPDDLANHIEVRVLLELAKNAREVLDTQQDTIDNHTKA